LVDGKPFDGAATYRLNVPANPPVAIYWSARAYDRATHAQNRDMPRASRSSQNVGLQKNADGSVDVYFGPKARRPAKSRIGSQRVRAANLRFFSGSMDQPSHYSTKCGRCLTSRNSRRIDWRTFLSVQYRCATGREKNTAQPIVGGKAFDAERKRQIRSRPYREVCRTLNLSAYRGWKQLDNFPHGTFDPSPTLIRDHYIFQGILTGAAIG
jgi:hypothetical protein